MTADEVRTLLGTTGTAVVTDELPTKVDVTVPVRVEVAVFVEVVVSVVSEPEELVLVLPVLSVTVTQAPVMETVVVAVTVVMLVTGLSITSSAARTARS